MEYAKARLPDYKEPLTGFQNQLKKIMEQNCAEAIRLANESTTPEGNALAAASMLANCQPALMKLRQDGVSFVDHQLQLNDETSKTLAKQTTNAVYTSLGLLAVTAAVLMALPSG